MTVNDETYPFEIGQDIELLRATPEALLSLLGGLSADWIYFQEEAEAWSPHTVAVHFVHNEQTNWMPRAKVVLSEVDEREFPPFHQLPEGGDLSQRSISELLDDFAKLREGNLETLSHFALKPEDYDRQAIHPVLGTVNLRQLLATWVVHDLNHLYQIAKSLAKRYGNEVGPWRPNLPILDNPS